MTQVLVVGGLNVDTLARITGPLTPGSSNPGRTARGAGGVARNVADNLHRLGDRCSLVGALGDDGDGDFLIASLDGIDTGRVRRVPGRTGSYTAVLGPDGELVVGVADMAATESLRPEDVPDPAGYDWLVLDGNLLPATVAALLDRASATRTPVALDPVGVAKAARLGQLADVAVHTFTPNRDELAAFTGTADLVTAVRIAHQRGVRWVWLREGAAGSRLFGPDGEEYPIPAIPGEVVDVTGAGDAMLAGYLHAHAAGDRPAAAAAYGAVAAALTVASPSTVRADLTDALVRRHLHTGAASTEKKE